MAPGVAVYINIKLLLSEVCFCVGVFTSIIMKAYQLGGSGMTSTAKRLLVHLGVYTVLFFIIPFLQTNSATGSMNDLGVWVLLLLMVNPAAVLIITGEAGLRIGFNLLMCLLPAVLFTASVYIFFEGNISALYYSVMYGVIAFASNGVGALFKNKTKRK